jgi:hypothetical protein
MLHPDQIKFYTHRALSQTNLCGPSVALEGPVKTEEDIEREAKLHKLWQQKRALDAEIRALGEPIT